MIVFKIYMTALAVMMALMLPTTLSYTYTRKMEKILTALFGVWLCSGFVYVLAFIVVTMWKEL